MADADSAGSCNNKNTPDDVKVSREVEFHHNEFADNPDNSGEDRDADNQC